jgi:hypothetical protein
MAAEKQTNSERESRSKRVALNAYVRKEKDLKLFNYASTLGTDK